MAKSYQSLIPSIERRLSAWMGVEDRLTHGQDTQVRTTITLSRQYGCEGFPLAERIKELLEARDGQPWAIFDKALIEQVAQDEKISKRLLQNLGDSSQLFDAIGQHFLGYHSHSEAFAKVAKYLYQIGQKGNAIIVGRGGAIICKELQNAFHFRLEASLEFRVQSMMHRLEIGEPEAREQVKTNERQREKFISECLNAKIGDLAHYDAVFNNERHGVEQIAQAILAYVLTPRVS